MAETQTAFDALDSETFTQVTTGTTDEFVMSVEGDGGVVLVWAATTPASGATGHTLQSGFWLPRNGVEGLVWARKTPDGNNPSLLVTE